MRKEDIDAVRTLTFLNIVAEKVNLCEQGFDCWIQNSLKTLSMQLRSRKKKDKKKKESRRRCWWAEEGLSDCECGCAADGNRLHVTWAGHTSTWQEMCWCPPESLPTLEPSRHPSDMWDHFAFFERQYWSLQSTSWALLLANHFPKDDKKELL